MALRFLSRFLVAAVLIAGHHCLHAETTGETISAEQIKLFETHIRPLLAARCVKCHGPKKQENELRLDSRSFMLKGGENGPAIVPGKPEKSLLVAAIRRESPEMPPDDEGKLSATQIAHVVEWIKFGAPWPEGERYAVRAKEKISDEDRAWWSFQPVRDPAVPKVDDGGWAKNDIDRFVFRRLQMAKSKPEADAERLALLRRAHFDLTGLPPSPDEIESYLADHSPDAYEKLIERLLSSPSYGEHQARLWLDLVRYAESDGYKQDALRPEAYRYRDYVIKSLNDDKPYDRFVMEQLAGDEIDPGNREAITATMFLRLWIYEYNQRDVEGQWQAILEDVTETTGDVFLGMGMGCARCHDHKFDPISQQDYYRLQAFFAPLFPRDDQPVASLEQRTEHYEKHQAWRAATEEIRRRLHEIENPILLAHTGGEGFNKFVPAIQFMIRKRRQDRTPHENQIAMMASKQFDVDRKKLQNRLQGELKQEWETLRKRLADFDHLKPKPLATIKFVVGDIGRTAPPTFVPDDPARRPIEPGFLSVIDPAPVSISPLPPALESTGRRTALARWIVDPANPLTARVIANRIWQHHFGRGLVATPSDFGRLGEVPSHPELLDHLASRLVAGGWRLKPLHKMMMMSATYRQAKKNPRRLSAEQIRDAMLAASGELDVRQGGKSVARDEPRRSIYTKAMRNSLDPFLAAFDAPDAIRSSDARNLTTTSTQALLLMNGPWTLSRAAAMAKRLRRDASGDADKIARRAFLLAFARPPVAAELADAVAFLEQEKTETSLVDFCHVLLNSNEFVYVD